MAFNASKLDWNAIDEAGGGSKLLPAGGYVATIVGGEDIERSEYMRFTYDIAEGAHKGFFADDDRDYTHQFTRSYTAKALPFMKRFLKCVEASNPGFDMNKWSGDPSALVGLTVGIIVQREDYTNKSGEDRARMNVEDFASADDIRNGRYKLPEPKDTREHKPETTHAASTGALYDADIPF